MNVEESVLQGTANGNIFPAFLGSYNYQRKNARQNKELKKRISCNTKGHR